MKPDDVNEGYIRHLEMQLEHLGEQRDNVMRVAMRGYVAGVAWKYDKDKGPMLEAVEWECPSCKQKQRQDGPCVNPACVPGEVMRALRKETRVERIMRLRNEDLARSTRKATPAAVTSETKGQPR